MRKPNSTMRLINVLWIVLLLALSDSTLARLMEGNSYREMFDKADLVVIARAISARDTPERQTILGVPVIGVNTEFEARLVLKGDATVRKFVLHHYRLANP